ncbi:MAG: porin family protein [Acidobacteriia bacterium]|nr:porin family protein [Terriglobia bacterium]
MFRKISMLVVSSLVFLSMAAAQEYHSDAAVSFTGVLNKDSSGNGLLQNPTHSGGLLASYRLALGNHSAVELNYGYSRNTQNFTGAFPGTFAAQQANVHEATAAYVLSMNRAGRLDPFVLGGGGALIFSPTGSSFNPILGGDTQAKGTFLYGAGVDYRLVRGLGLRLQYRGLVYKAPDFGLSAISTDSWTHTAEPSVGLTFRF